MGGGFDVGLFGCLFVSLGWVGFLLSLIICYVILQCCLFGLVGLCLVGWCLEFVCYCVVFCLLCFVAVCVCLCCFEMSMVGLWLVVVRFVVGWWGLDLWFGGGCVFCVCLVGLALDWTLVCFGEFVF